MTTTIQLNEATHKSLKSMRGNGESFNDVITNLLVSIAGCPKCGDGELRIKRSYMFEPLFFDLECENCDHVEKRWKIPFKPLKEGEK